MEIAENRMWDTEKILFPLLSRRDIATVWASNINPRDALRKECSVLISDETFRLNLATYLKSNPVIQHSLNSVIYQLSFSAGVSSEHASEILQPSAKIGQSISRWLPTFLLIDGPLGRLLRQRPSPLAEKLQKTSYLFPLLCDARDAFNNDFFRYVRNGFAHWSFLWNANGTDVTIELFHYETGDKELEISLLEGEALHYLSASVIQIIDEELLRKAINSNLLSTIPAD